MGKPSIFLKSSSYNNRCIDNQYGRMKAYQREKEHLLQQNLIHIDNYFVTITYFLFDPMIVLYIGVQIAEKVFE
jgi:hypothetical protein